MKVLIVEDEIFSANSLKLMVEKLGYKVVDIVNNAKDAMRSYKEHKPDMVLLDIMLKGNISGSELALKLSMENKDLIIIFLTAYSDEEMINYAIDAKAYAYLLKPYRDAGILATLKLAKEELKARKGKNIEHNIRLKLMDEYIYNLEQRKLYYKNMEISITKNMSTLLYILCSNPNKYISSKKLMNEIWGSSNKTDSLRSLIYRLKKISSKNIITNSIKDGYKINVL